MRRQSINIAFLVGLASIVAGLGMIHPAAAFIGGGITLVIMAFAMMKRHGTTTPNKEPTNHAG